jgi:hypothetical protein
MHSNIAALTNSALETAGGAGSFFASKFTTASPGTPGFDEIDRVAAGWGDGLREAIRKTVEVSCAEPSPQPSPDRPNSPKSGVPGEEVGGDVASRVCHEDAEKVNAGASAAAACAKAHPTSKKRKRGPTSERQREANRANAAKSTGPKTEEGKANSSANAFKHGVFTHASFLPGEDEQAFAAMENLLIADYGPATVMEEILLGRMASIQWKLERLMSAEEELGWRQRYKRMDNYQQQLHLSELSKLCPPPSDKPHEVSSGWEIFADDFQSNGKQGKLQQITQLEMRLTGQMLAISRQLVQIRKLRIIEGKAAMGDGAREENEPAARNEAIRSNIPCSLTEEAKDVAASGAGARTGGRLPATGPQ